MKKNYVFTFTLVSFITSLFAQSVCQEQLVVNNGVSGQLIGQSIFMAECTGFFTSIELDRTDDGEAISAELIIFNGQTFMGTPRYTQTITIPESTEPFTIDFNGGTGDLAFFEDSQYTFMLSSSELLQLEASSDIDSYQNGQLFIDVGFINNDDLWFKLETSSTLGIDNHELNNLLIFPNPASNYIQVSGIYIQETFTVYNVLGAIVKTGTITDNNLIEIHNLPVGLYYLKLSEGGTLKFIKK